VCQENVSCAQEAVSDAMAAEDEAGLEAAKHELADAVEAANQASTALAESVDKLANQKCHAEQAVAELEIINSVHHQVWEVLQLAQESREIKAAMQACEEIQNRLCGDLRELSLVPGRRLIFNGELCTKTGGQVRGVTVFLFNDVVVTTAQGTTNEFEVFLSKAELYMSVVEAVGARLKLVEHDQLTATEMFTHVFECDTEETAHKWKEKIQAAIRALTRTREWDVVDDVGGGYLQKEQESLAQTKVRLDNEVLALREKERDIENRLREQMTTFVGLRDEQWEADAKRVEIGLTVDPRTLAQLQSETLENAAAPEDERAARIEGILDNLIRKYEALEEVLTMFALQPIDKNAPIDATDPSDTVHVDGQTEANADASEGVNTDVSAEPVDTDAASEPSSADFFWNTIQRVRTALGTLDNKMQDLDNQFWECRLLPTGPNGEDLGAEGMTTREMNKAVVMMTDQLKEDQEAVANLDAERLKLEQKCEHALRGLQNVNRKANYIQK